MRRRPLYGYIQLQMVWLVTGGGGGGGGLSLQGKNTVIELKLDDNRVVSVCVGVRDAVLGQGCRSFSLDGCCYIHCNILSFSVCFAVRLQ